MNKKTILLLEDDDDLRALYCLWLEAADYRVVMQANSKDIDQLIGAHHPALVITDMMMPDFDGVEGIFKILDRYNIPIIAISASESHLHVFGELVTTSLLKPLYEKQLVAEVNRILGMQA